ncbi:MAG TPA: serine/threonine-protein kinase [Tepidisphaeraceae bacterium]|jgi:serine/threonine protein kinase
MGNSRLLQIKAIFAEAMEKDASERAAFIAVACGGDSDLQAEVEAFLSAAVRAGDFLNSPTHDSSVSLGTSSEPLGTTIGRYKLLELIGEGGFGSVYMAEQESPVRRKVALKIIKLGMDTKQVIARFEAERQALAMMEHPNIAKVFDAGTTETGRPYFVMELARGIPITEYCDLHKLNTKERLELFSSVCEAVQHAHQKGIIHRDLKPSNVVITMQDGTAVPKIIDFGIAKATNQRLTEKTLFTEFRQMIGTPAYMSPEQADFTTQDIDTRSDIYSLGVLLYELLTGGPPFETSQLLRLGYEQMQRTIREIEPARPSERLSGLQQETLITVAQLRGSDDRQLTRSIRGDLDWIVMKCLEKDRRRRYESASALAGDLDRYLANEPVEATPPSAMYRLQKFTKRNRTGLILTAAFLLLAALSIGLYIHGIRSQQLQTETALAEAKSQRQEADRQRDEAKKQQQIASAENDFLTNMLTSADPWRGLGDKLTVLQVVQAAQKDVDAGSLKDQPLVEAAIRQALAEALTSLGHYPESEENLKKALSIDRRLLPPDDPRMADALWELERLYQSTARWSEAESLGREILRIRRQAFPETSIPVANALISLAADVCAEGKYVESEAYATDGLNIKRKLLSADDTEISFAMLALAQTVVHEGKLTDSENLNRQALQMLQKAHPPNNSGLANAQFSLGWTLIQERKYRDGEKLIRQSLAMKRKLGGDYLFGTLSLAELLLGQGRLADARQLYHQLFDRDESMWSSEYAAAAAMLRNLAYNLGVKVELKDAGPSVAAVFGDDEGLFLKIYNQECKQYGPTDPHLTVIIDDVATCLWASGKSAKASSILSQALLVDRKAAPSGALDTALLQHKLGLITLAQGKAIDAEANFRHSLAIRRKALPADDPLIATDLHCLGDALVAQGNDSDAEKFYREALDIRRKKLSAKNLYIASTLERLAVLLIRHNQLTEAEPMLRETLEIRKPYVASSPNVATTARELAELLDRTGRSTEAASLRQQFVQNHSTTLPTSKPSLNHLN